MCIFIHIYILMYIYIWHFPICCLVQNAPFWPRQCLLCHTADTVWCDTPKNMCAA